MRISIKAPLIAFGALLLLGGPAAIAQTTDKLWRSCTTSAQSPDDGVAACSKLLARGSKLSKADQVLALLNRGVGHYSARRYQESIDDNSAALALEPGNATALSNRADGYFSLGRFDEAVTGYTEALARDPSKTSIYRWRGHANFSLNRYEDAVRDFDEALALEPNVASMLYDRGRSKAFLNRWQEALADYDAALAQDSNDARYHYDRAVALHNLRRYTDAEIGYDAALSRDPSLVDAWSGKAGVRLDLGDLAGAENGYRKAVSVDPKNAFALTGLANTLLRLERHQEAASVFDTAIAQGGASAWTYADRARARIIMGQADLAIEDANEALRLDANNADALYIRGLCRRVRGDFEGSAADLDAALALTPENVWALSARAEMLIREENHDRARPFLERMANAAAGQIANGSDTPDNLNELRAFRGWAIAMTGRTSEGLAELEAVAASARNKETPLYFKGIVHYHEGDYDAASRDFGLAQAATRAVYSKAQYRIERARALEKLGKWAEARIAYEEALQLMPAFVEARIGLERVKVGASLATTPTPQPEEKVASVDPDPAPEPAAPVDLGKRVALVIGNSRYENVAQLPNPSRDAEEIAETLRSVGFSSVEVATDLSQDAFNSTLRSFARTADGADWALVYYAGHGIEVNNTNYLVPVDATLAMDRDLEFEATPLDRVVRAVEGATKMRIVILDACRENPFDATMKRTSSTRSVSRGLARVEPDGGTLIAYAAKAGQVALDGDQGNSPFVRALTERMRTPGLEIGKMFRLVRDDVLAATGRKQEPFLYGSLPGEDLYIVPPQ